MAMRVVHCKREPYDVYIGRPSLFGNPFSHLEKSLARFRCSSREEAISRYEEWVREQPSIMEKLSEIAGKTLGCWCFPNSCHGDVLIKICREKGLIE